MAIQRKTRKSSAINKMKKVAEELSRVIDFDPPINTELKHLVDLHGELRVNAEDLIIEDKKLLSKQTWNYLEQGGFIDHLKEEEVEVEEVVEEEGEEEEVEEEEEVDEEDVEEEELEEDEVEQHEVKLKLDTQHKKDTKESESESGIEDLIAIANNMNKVMGLVPPIDTKAEQDILNDLIADAAKEVLMEDKSLLNIATWGYLNSNGLIEHLCLKKKPAKKPAEKKKPSPIPKNKKPTKERMIRIGALIAESKYTAKEIVKILNNEFDMFTPSSHSTVISDSRNVKYNKLPKLVIQDPETKVLSFS